MRAVIQFVLSVAAVYIMYWLMAWNRVVEMRWDDED